MEAPPWPCAGKVNYLNFSQKKSGIENYFYLHKVLNLVIRLEMLLRNVHASNLESFNILVIESAR